jgi:hypothetical protein
VSKLTKKARNALIANAALSIARDRLVPTAKPRPRRGRKLLFGGVIAALGAGLLLKRDKVAALLPGRSEEFAPAPPAPPAPSNYDVGGPVANTATAVPAPDPVQPPAIDEAAEEAAAPAPPAGLLGGRGGGARRRRGRQHRRSGSGLRGRRRVRAAGARGGAPGRRGRRGRVRGAGAGRGRPRGRDGRARGGAAAPR